MNQLFRRAGTIAFIPLRPISKYFYVGPGLAVSYMVVEMHMAMKGTSISSISHVPAYALLPPCSCIEQCSHRNSDSSSYIPTYYLHHTESYL